MLGIHIRMICLSFIKGLHDVRQSIITLIQVYNVLIGVLNTTGNSILIWGLRRTRQTKTISFHFIIAMSVSDLTIGVIGLTFMTLVSMEPYQNYCWLKLAIQFALNTCNYFSVFMVFLIAVDRYLHMKYLEQYSAKFSKKRGHLLIVLLFGVALLVSTLFTLPFSSSIHGFMEMVFFSMSILFLVSIIILYQKALRAMRIAANKITKSLINHSRTLGRAGRRISICVLVLIAPIVIILLLHGINSQLNLFNSSNLIPFTWFAFITFLGNGFCSSVIFIFQNIPIRRVLARILRQKWNSIHIALGTIERNS